MGFEAAHLLRDPRWKTAPHGQKSRTFAFGELLCDRLARRLRAFLSQPRQCPHDISSDGTGQNRLPRRRMTELNGLSAQFQFATAPEVR